MLIELMLITDHRNIRFHILGIICKKKNGKRRGKDLALPISGPNIISCFQMQKR